MDRKLHVPTKLERAREHLVALDSEVTSFFEMDPFSTSIEKHGTGYALILHAKAEPPTRWGAVVGDVVHNLRSSLDVAVYQLVEQNGAKPSSSTAFPMVRSAGGYTKTANRLTVGVHSDVREAIDASRPYPTGNDDLFLLHQLSIEDKHHLLLALAAGADQGIAIGAPSAPGPTGYRIQPIQVFGREHSKHLFPLQEGSVLMRTEGSSEEQAAVLQHFSFFPFIAIKPAGWDLHEDVFILLDRLAKAVRSVIDDLSMFF